MFGKLATRNVKRQVGNYLIYFITVSMTVALMFAVNSLIFSSEMNARAAQLSGMSDALLMLVLFVALIVAFVLGYATSFMLKLRKREFGTYLTLGMTRRNILSIFVTETLLLGAAALAAGLMLGLFLYQGLMALLSGLMEMEFTLASYSVKGILVTVVLVTAMFVLASVTSARYLKKVSIYELLHGSRKVEKNVRRPVLWLMLAVVSLGMIAASCVLFDRFTIQMMRGEGGSMVQMLGCFGMLSVGIVLFHIGLAKGLVGMLLKNRRLCSKMTNTFVLRQLSGRLNSSSVLAGVLAFLITFAIIGANVSFMQKVSAQRSLDRTHPFDVHFIRNTDDGAVAPDRPGEERGEQLVSKYAPIQAKIPYDTYKAPNGYLYSFTRWSGDGYGGLTDSLLKESDYNRLMTALGHNTIRLEGKFQIIANNTEAQSADFSQAVLNLNGGPYAYGGTLYDVPMLSYVYFMAVVPDDACKGLEVESSHIVYDLGGAKYDATALDKELSYSYTEQFDGQAQTGERSDYLLREYGRMGQNAQNAILVVGALYAAMLFVFLAMAILALKTLSGLSEDRQRYAILFRLGAGRREQCRALFRQIFSFFLLPFALPLAMSIPTQIICTRIMNLAPSGATSDQVLVCTVAIAAVTTAVYLLYFAATYLLAKRNILREEK